MLNRDFRVPKLVLDPKKSEEANFINFYKSFSQDMFLLNFATTYAINFNIFNGKILF